MAGHHHHNGHHHHHHDDKQGGEDGTRITLIGAALNVVLTVSKLVAGRWTHSPSLVADAFHSASDLIADCITFVTYSWSRKPRDAHYPLGYHSQFISLMHRIQSLKPERNVQNTKPSAR